MLLAKASTLLKYSISVYDVKGAILNSDISEEIYVHDRFDQELSKIFVEGHPALKQMLNLNGLSPSDSEDIFTVFKNVH